MNTTKSGQTTEQRRASAVASGAMVREWLASNGAPLRGKIHLHCRTCGRFKRNMPRAEGDPENAALLITQCDRCNRGDFSLEDYVDIAGQDVVAWRASPNTGDVARGGSNQSIP